LTAGSDDRIITATGGDRCVLVATTYRDGHLEPKPSDVIRIVRADYRGDSCGGRS